MKKLVPIALVVPSLFFVLLIVFTSPLVGRPEEVLIYTSSRSIYLVGTNSGFSLEIDGPVPFLANYSFFCNGAIPTVLVESHADYIDNMYSIDGTYLGVIDRRNWIGFSYGYILVKLSEAVDQTNLVTATGVDEPSELVYLDSSNQRSLERPFEIRLMKYVEGVQTNQILQTFVGYTSGELSPSRTQIAFHKRVLGSIHGGDVSQISLVDIDQNTGPVVFETDMHIADYQWLPDSEGVVVVTAISHLHNLVIIDTVNGGSTKLAEFTFFPVSLYAVHVAVSPSGNSASIIMVGQYNSTIIIVEWDDQNQITKMQEVIPISYGFVLSSCLAAPPN